MHPHQPSDISHPTSLPFHPTRHLRNPKRQLGQHPTNLVDRGFKPLTSIDDLRLHQYAYLGDTETGFGYLVDSSAIKMRGYLRFFFFFARPLLTLHAPHILLCVSVNSWYLISAESLSTSKAKVQSVIHLNINHSLLGKLFDLFTYMFHRIAQIFIIDH